MIRYKIPEYNNAQEFLSHIARKRGKLKKGGVPDYNDAARIVLQDWNNGGISYYTVPPKIEETQPKSIYETAKVVSSFSEEFNIDALFEEGDKDVMVLPSIDSVPENSFVETMYTDESELDCLFVNMAISAESKKEESEDELDMEGMDVEEQDSTPHIKNPVRAADEFNPQTNQKRKKELKKQRKKDKKRPFVQESFDFATDFVADNDIDDDDEDLLDIE